MQGKGSNCSQCFRQISGPLAIRPPSDALSPTYCSKECQLQASVQHHALLFGSNPPVVVDASQAVAIDPTKVEARKAAQATLVERINSSGKAGLLLVARFIGRMVSDETKKLTASTSGSAKPPGDDYSIFDHIERLRYLEIDESDVSKDNEALGEVLKLSAEGLEEFLKNGRYAMLLGKMAYNAIGVTFSGGRDDKVLWTHMTMGLIGLNYLFLRCSRSRPCLSRKENGPGLRIAQKGRSGLVFTLFHLM